MGRKPSARSLNWAKAARLSGCELAECSQSDETGERSSERSSRVCRSRGRLVHTAARCSASTAPEVPLWSETSQSCSEQWNFLRCGRTVRCRRGERKPCGRLRTWKNQRHWAVAGWEASRGGGGARTRSGAGRGGSPRWCSAVASAWPSTCWCAAGRSLQAPWPSPPHTPAPRSAIIPRHKNTAHAAFWKGGHTLLLSSMEGALWCASE